MTDLLENGTTGDLRNSPAHAQVVRRWTATVLMYFSTVLGALATFGFTEDIGSPKSSGISESAQLALIGVGAGLALLCVLPTVGLARRIRLREAKAGWTTIVVGCLVLIAAGRSAADQVPRDFADRRPPAAHLLEASVWHLGDHEM